MLGLVFGDPAEISSYLIPHPVIRKVTFTGSTPVGKQLAALAGLHMKRATMELGGHAPVIIAEDADVALAVKAAGGAKFRNAGQVCISPTRFLVHNAVKAEFTRALVQHAESLKIGRRPGGRHHARASGQCAPPERDGQSSRRCPGQGRHAGHRRRAVGDDRQFLRADDPFRRAAQTPASSTTSRSARSPASAASTIWKTMIAEANRLPYGLAGYAFTRSIKNAQLLMNRVEVGMLWINQPATPSAEMPFGGIKDSGYGSEGGPEAMESYLNTKSVSMVGV